MYKKTCLRASDQFRPTPVSLANKDCKRLKISNLEEDYYVLIWAFGYAYAKLN